jgi:hypothetical protein
MARGYLAVKHQQKLIQIHAQRTLILKELTNTEVNYVEDLRVLLEEYHGALMATRLLPTDKLTHLFSTIPQMYSLHHTLLNKVKEKMANWGFGQTVGDVFTPKEMVTPYTTYILSYESLVSEWKSIRKENTKIHQFFLRVAKTKEKLIDFDSLLITPIQRIPRYLLLLKDMYKFTHTDHPDSSLLLSVISDFEKLLAYLNEMKRQNDSKKKFVEFSEQFSDFTHCFQRLDDGKNVDRHVYLHEGPLELFHNPNYLRAKRKAMAIKFQTGIGGRHTFIPIQSRMQMKKGTLRKANAPKLHSYV